MEKYSKNNNNNNNDNNYRNKTNILVANTNK